MFMIVLLAIMIQACSSPSIEEAKQFDITSETTELFLEKSLQDKTVLQSFAFDDVNKHIYVLQVMSGGHQLPGENSPVNWNTRSFDGDLTLTKLDMEGNQLGYMYLKGFGHGVAMGIEIEKDKPYIWMEADSINDGERGWGSKLIRFSFENEAIIDSTSEDLDKYAPIPTADHTTVNIDKAYGLLTMRYRMNGSYRFATFPLDKVKKGEYEAIYDIPQPKDIKTFQGFASYGKYLYLLEGNSFENIKADEEKGNTYITVVDLTNGKALDKQFIESGFDLPFREPEGMAISIPNIDKPEEAILNFGFASTVSESDSTKLINIFRFEQFVDQTDK